MTYPIVHQMKWAPINAGALGDNTIIAGVSGKKLRVVNLYLTAGLAVALQLKSGPNVKVGAMSLLAATPFVMNMSPGCWVVETEAGEAFVINSSVATGLRGGCNYVEI